MRAEKVVPPEDAGALSALTQEWMGVYKPQSPGQVAALQRCCYFELQFSRIKAAEAAALDDHINQGPIDWERGQREQVASHTAMLINDPEGSVTALKDTAAGCRKLIGEWSTLKAALERDGYWDATSHRDQAIRLLGLRPGDGAQELVFWISLMNLCAREVPDPQALAWYLERRNIPDTLRRVIGDAPPPREFCMTDLRARVDEELAILEAREEYLRIQVEEPARRNAPKRRLVLEGEEGARIMRYMRMNDTAYNRNYKQLLKGDVEVVQAVETAKESTCGEEKGPEIAIPSKANVPSEGAPSKANVPSRGASRWGKFEEATDWDPELSAMVALADSMPIRQARIEADLVAKAANTVGSGEGAGVVPVQRLAVPPREQVGGAPSGADPGD